ncbi:MAG TPA: LysR family transcriptional regulator [Ktedonobacteraceae bacterium]|nr:LysR family transcriptional regulator [Ktedonobacteraceae bacterium]
MNLQYLRVFLAVAEHEHITRASEELIISQPAVTKTIQNLEYEIGLELIERHGRRIVLTHAGHVLHSYARRIFALEREMEEGISALRDVEAGEVTLAANTTTGVYLLPPIVARFRTRYPQVMLNISILNSHEIVEETLSWKLDFGVVESDPAHLPEDLKVEVFAHDELVLVVGNRHRWRGVRSLSPEALAESELVVREEGSGIREVIEQALLQHNVQVAPLLTLPDNEAIKQMVMSGVGVSIVSALAVQRELASGDLIRIPIAGVELHPQLSLVMRKDKQLSRAAQAFCALLRP